MLKVYLKGVKMEKSILTFHAVNFNLIPSYGVFIQPLMLERKLGAQRNWER